VAPRRREARLNKPDPLPASRKVFPDRFSTRSISRSDFSAASTRSSSNSRKKRDQLAPNSNRPPASTPGDADSWSQDQVHFL